MILGRNSAYHIRSMFGFWRPFQWHDDSWHIIYHLAQVHLRDIRHRDHNFPQEQVRQQFVMTPYSENKDCSLDRQELSWNAGTERHRINGGQEGNDK